MILIPALLATLGAAPVVGPPLTNLMMWWKADAITGLSDGASVSSWLDSSGNGNTLLQGTGGNQPVYKVSIVNSLPIVRFNGTSSYMNSSTAIPSSPASWFVVAAITEAAGSETAYAPFVISQGPMRLCAALSTPNWGTFTGDGDESAGENLVNGTFNLLEYIKGPNTGTVEHTLYRNGTLKLDHTGADGSGSVNDVGAEPGQSRFLKGDIAEILIYLGALSSANQILVENYIHSKYAIF